MGGQSARPVSCRPLNVQEKLLIGNIVPSLNQTLVSGQAGELEGWRGWIDSGAVLKNGEMGLVVSHCGMWVGSLGEEVLFW